ncbi:PREDICTED: serine carboxypeptidase-like 16 [Camelina sativa]|uniref:Serine carboxypeptidase-like 16 n=1 Tax=Camelina sativa TaxID=90675 RepID=A0ABM0W527_CAMSA|nr:PREDICTED: serine carboxypeptidase-like 16 [Camelina sativa]
MCSWIPMLLLLLHLMLLFTNYADSSSIIRSLPGFDGPLPFELETGYIGVGDADEDQMFYYFIKSESNPKEDPLLLWLTGGPGCSSFFGLVYENGPIAFKVKAYNGSIPTLVSTTYSWTKFSNVIYLDQPVGTGFSYSKNPLADIPSDTGSTKRVDEFLRKWLAQHPEYSSNPFYVTGNSYAGTVVPVIVQEISNGNCICCKPQINLQGYVLGSPITDFDLDRNSRIQYAHRMALISDELYESMKRSCGGNYITVDPLNTECLELIEDYDKCVSGINENLILAPNCDMTSPDCYMYIYMLSEYWANNKESVRRALKVVEGTTGKWLRCKRTLQYNKDIKSSIPYHKKNSIEGYRSLIISGDHDLVTPYVGTHDWIRSLNYSIIDKWRPWMILDQVAGYTTTYANEMTFATVKGGGHTLDFKPEEHSILLKRWISGQPL